MSLRSIVRQLRNDYEAGRVAPVQSDPDVVLEFPVLVWNQMPAHLRRGVEMVRADRQ